MADICSKHAGLHNERARSDLEQKMKDLDYCQAGEGRHKCTYCAYEKGFEEGYEQAMQELNK